MAMEFQEITSLNEVERLIDESPLAFLYITQPNCSVCHGLQPQIEAMLSGYPKINARHVDARKVPELAGRCNIFTAPVPLLFVHGKEYLREARLVQADFLEQQM